MAQKMNDDAFTADEIGELRKLLEIEKIRKKKLLYSQLMDSLDLEGFSDLYTEDAVADWGPAGTWHGRAEIFEQIKIAYEGRGSYDGFHITTNLWIEMTGEGAASSRCYLFGVDARPNPRVNPTASFAVYEEDWVRVGSDWKINRHRIFFLWPERHVPEDFPRLMLPTPIG